jgi:hypothetical protein
MFDDRGHLPHVLPFQYHSDYHVFYINSVMEQDGNLLNY